MGDSPIPFWGRDVGTLTRRVVSGAVPGPSVAHSGGDVDRFAELVLRHRLAISLMWLMLFLAGIIAAGQLSSRLTVDFSLPGQPGYEAEQQLIKDYGVSSFDTFVPVLTVPAGETVAGNKQQVARVFQAIRDQVPDTRFVAY